MSIRKDVLTEISSNINERGIIPLSEKGRVKARKNYDRTRENYEGARGDLLRQELGRFYRVVIFGSARLPRESEELIFITNLSKALVEAKDVDIVTGGGTGVMEAAHRGTRFAIGEAITNGRRLRAKNHGERIQLPFEEVNNEFIHIGALHPEFSTRLQAFLDKTHAAYIYVGGVGTLLELMMLVQTRQVDHIEKEYPVIAHPFWKPTMDTWNDQMYHNRVSSGQTPLISENDLELIKFSDDIPEIVGIISENYDSWRKSIRDHIRVIP